MRLAELVDTSLQVAATRKRLEKTGRLAELLRRLAPDEVAIGVAYLSGELPQGKVGIGPAAVRAAASVPPAEYATLELLELHAAFDRMCALAGPGSQRARTEALHELLRRATAAEQRFLSRLVIGELRQGALGGLMADAVARAADLPLAEVRRALMLSGDAGAVARAALLEGRAGLDRFDVELFRPVQPMLAQPAAGAASAIERLGRAAVDYKLDGARIQVHREGDDVRVFTRRLHDVTAAVPEVVAAARRLPARRCILDGEAIAFDPGGRPLPFQTTMRRFGRRLDVDRLRRELPLSALYFDLLLHDDDSLIDEPTVARRARLVATVPDAQVVPAATAESSTAVEAFLDEALAHGHEGILAKALDAPYAAGARGSSWLKLKPAHTLDLVVLAAEWGSGRRRGWLSNLHLGARDPDRGGFVMLGKTFKGMTDATLAWQTEQLLAREIARDEWTVHVRPELVGEIAFNDVQTSPHYPGGVALRFARLKGYRPDKSPEEADTIATVRGLLGGSGRR